MACLAEHVPQGYSLLFFVLYCIGFNVAFQIKKNLDLLFLLLVGNVKLLRLFKTTMW